MSIGQRSRQLERKCINRIPPWHIIVKSGSIYVKPKRSTAHSAHVVEYIAPFCDVCQVCLPVCHIPFVRSILERGRKFVFFEKLPLMLVNYDVILRSKGQRSILAYHRQKWIDLRYTDIKTSGDPLYTYRQIHFTSENALFLRYFSVCLSHTSNTFRSLYIGTRQKYDPPCGATLSVAHSPSVRPEPPIFSKLENHRHF